MSVNILLFFRFVSKFCHSLYKNRADSGLLRLNAAFLHQFIHLLEVVVALVYVDKYLPFAKDEDFFKRRDVVAGGGCIVLGKKAQFL